MFYGEETCRQLKEMMRNNVASQYGQAQFGDLARVLGHEAGQPRGLADVLGQLERPLVVLVKDVQHPVGLGHLVGQVAHALQVNLRRL